MNEPKNIPMKKGSCTIHVKPEQVAFWETDGFKRLDQPQPVKYTPPPAIKE